MCIVCIPKSSMQLHRKSRERKDTIGTILCRVCYGVLEVTCYCNLNKRLWEFRKYINNHWTVWIWSVMIPWKHNWNLLDTNIRDNYDICNIFNYYLWQFWNCEEIFTWDQFSCGFTFSSVLFITFYIRKKVCRK